MLFIQSPDEVFYVRELTRRVGTQINAVRREIQNLSGIGLITEGASKDGEAKLPGLKRKYYTANMDFPLMQEVRALLLKAYALMEWKLEDRIKSLGDVRYLALMGYFIGQANQPVDVFVVGEVSKNELKELIRQAEEKLGAEINYTVMTSQEYAYRKEMADRFLESILKSPKSVVIDALDKV